MQKFLKSLFTFNGRTGRVYYIVSLLFFFSFYFSLVYLLFILNKNLLSGIIQDVVGIIMGILGFWIWIAITTKRYHDFGWSGFNFLWSFVPMVNSILFLVLIFRKGTDGPNEYGEPPK